MRAGWGAQLLTLVAMFALATMACSGDDDEKAEPEEAPSAEDAARPSEGCGSARSVTRRGSSR
jgi:hypothetical protein